MQKTNRNSYNVFAFILIAFTLIVFVALVCCFATIKVEFVAHATAWDGTVAADYDGGNGLENTPYQISSGATLAYLSQQVNGGNTYSGVYFALTNDIIINDITDFSLWATTPPANSWLGIGGESNPFMGNFEGGGNTIIGLYSNVDEFGGLFGYTDGATIAATNISHAHIFSNAASGALAGTITQTNVSGCNIYDSLIIGRTINQMPEPPQEDPIILPSSNLGAICGVADGAVITACFSNATVLGDQICGGLVGESTASTLSKCFFRGEVAASYHTAGGIVGINGSIVESCFSEGIVWGNDKVGGLVGISDNALATVDKCFSLTTIDTDVETASEIGALIGVNYGSMDNTYYNIDITPFYPTGAHYDFGENGKRLLDIVGSGLETKLGTDWTYTDNIDNEYFYPQLTEFYDASSYSFTAYIIMLLMDNLLYGKLLCMENVAYVLPTVSELGITSTWQTADGTISWGDIVTEITPTTSATYYLKSVVNLPTLVTESADIDIVFDNSTHNINITADCDFGAEYIQYEWYYKSTGMEEYSLIDSGNSFYPTKNVTDSGLYYCLFWVEYEDILSPKASSRTFSVTIAKKDIDPESIPELEILEGTYDAGKTLADYTLNANFYWTDATIVPSCDRNYGEGTNGGYSVYYNTDITNYNSYYLTGYIILSKATHEGITHNTLSGVYLATNKLSDFSLAENFRWANGNITPVVTITSYAAIYNTDEINYEDYQLNITLNLTKATYQGITHTELSDIYNPLKTLSDYPLYNSYYKWKDGTIVPTVAVSKYEAIFNADSDNYFDYAFFITVHVLKATPTAEAGFVTPTKIFAGDSLPLISVVSSSALGTIAWDEDTFAVGQSTYYWTFSPTDSGNYKQLKTGVVFTVLEVAVCALQITLPPTKTAYYALEQVDSSGMQVTAIYNNDQTEIITAYQIGYQNDEYFIYGDTYFIVSFTVAELTFTAHQSVTVQRITVAVPSISATYYYNGAEQTHDIEESDYYTVEGEEQIQAGTYYLSAVLGDKTNYCWQDSTADDKTVTWIINRQEITKPTVLGEYIYNGLLQEVQIAEDDRYSLSNRREKAVGTYSVLAIINDKENYCWVGGETDNLSLVWEITKYLVEKPTYTESNFVYNGEAQTALITKSIVYVIANDTYTNAGNYAATVTLKDTLNYCWADGTNSILTYSFVINKQVVPIPIMLSGNFIYSGNVQKVHFSPSNAYIISGDSQINAGAYVVLVAIDTKNYEWEGGGGDTFSFDFVIAKLKIDKPIITGSYVYNGEEQEVIITTNDYYTLGNIAFTNAGFYGVDVTLNDTNNTEWSDGTVAPIQVTYTVEKKAVDRVMLNNVTFIYSGTIITYNLPIDMNVFEVSGNKNTTSGSYTAQIALKHPNNYVWQGENQANCTAPYQILPQSVTKPQCNQTNFYLGIQQSAAIAESAIYTLDNNKATDVGSYHAIVTLKDTHNYKWEDGTTSPFTIAWQIAKAKIDKPSKGSDLFYNGLIQKYDIAENPFYTLSGNVGTEGGEYTATVALRSKTNTEWSDGTVDNLSFVWNIYYIKGNTGEGEHNITAFSNSNILDTPEKDGYIFLGWYTNADFSGERVLSVNGLSGDTTLYARWGAMENITQDNQDKSGLSVKGIVGLSVGGVLALLAVALIAYSFIKKKGKSKQTL